MRRKSERNKAKAASPEKETERATRKSTRRRAKRAASESPDMEAPEEPAKPVTSNQETTATATIVISSPTNSKSTEETVAEGRSEATKTKVSKEEEESGVWTVSREDASPGEIQKLKLSRQPNSGSEGSSEGGWSRRKKKEKQGKWRESGVAEEADSEACPSIGEVMPSSSCPGQDSNEEVSDSKEILPETTCSADLLLSDDKPNIDERKRGEASLSSPDVASGVVVVAKREETAEATSSEEEEDSKRCDSSTDTEHTRNSRRKHRSKYGNSSNSESQESEEEAKKVTINEELCANNERSEREEINEEEEEEVIVQVNVKIKESVACVPAKIEAEEEQVEEKKTQDLEEKQETQSPGIAQNPDRSNNCRPVKVNLKRSFSVRVQMEKIQEEADVACDSNVANKENLDNGEQDPRSVPRKRRWGTALSTDSAPSFSISTDSLKALVPGARPLSITEVRLSKDDDEDRYRATEKWQNSGDQQQNEAKSGDEAQKNGAAGKKSESKLENHIARRKISIVKETAAHVKSPSPPATKPTNILLIKNLVRPFTLNQIKELLSRTGTIVENGFWMDRIKSKCFVEYANEDQAFETRQALHGISWPISNPKRLHVEYATKDDMELAWELSKDQSIPRKTEPLVPSDSWQQDWNRDERTNTKVMVVREWDLGKEDGQQHVKEKEKKEHEKKRRQRSRSPAVEPHLPAPARKFKKKEDEPPPAKLLDDLFRKTKATPCIYWLPLTNEQIVVKEEMRRQHMAEHARRLEEMRRAERNRDGRRRRSPRK